jgi:hypothetical protein
LTLGRQGLAQIRRNDVSAVKQMVPSFGIGRRPAKAELALLHAHPKD